MKKAILFLLVISSLFGFNSITSENLIEGKVIKAYTARGYGRMGNEWLFMDIKNGSNIYHIAIAPTFRIANLGINEGDLVKIDGVNPPFWPSDVIKAFDIYDITQKKEYPINGYYGWRGGYYR